MMEFALRHEVEQEGLSGAVIKEREAAQREQQAHEAQLAREAVTARAKEHTALVQRKREVLWKQKLDHLEVSPGMRETPCMSSLFYQMICRDSIHDGSDRTPSTAR